MGADLAYPTIIATLFCIIRLRDHFTLSSLIFMYLCAFNFLLLNYSYFTAKIGESSEEFKILLRRSRVISTMDQMLFRPARPMRWKMLEITITRNGYLWILQRVVADTSINLLLSF